MKYEDILILKYIYKYRIKKVRYIIERILYMRKSI